MIIETIDDITPARAFQALRHLPTPFILSGSKEGKRRHSYVGADPSVTITTEAGSTRIKTSNSPLKTHPNNDPFEALSEILSERRYAGGAGFPFNGGAVGYFSYDLKNIIEPSIATAKTDTDTGPSLPECALGLYDPIFVYDHFTEKGCLVSADGNRDALREMRSTLACAPERLPSRLAPSHGTPRFSSNTTKKQYLDSFERAQQYISAGDIYQINLSQRLSIPFDGDPFSLYLALVELHPAPFSSFIDMGGFQIISNTPERLLRVSGSRIETMPIKGTRPRGNSPDLDQRMIEELKGSVKERAEHVMIVDLERNDLGKISVAGSVEVAGFETIETYPHLHHMVTTVRARLRPELSSPEALRGAFPGGSITGAPKIRAMEIIDELEVSKRGIYTGGIGWIDFNGDMDVSMAIRTAVCQDGHLELSVGGGIVADSVGTDEYDESILKALDFLAVTGVKDGLYATL